MENTNTQSVGKRLSKKQMWIFAIGQLGWSLMSGLVGTWLVTFYLPTASDIEAGAIQYLTPGLVIGGFLTLLGLVTFICRIFDAVTDPLIASWSDGCKSKLGRRIPFMRWSALPLAAMTVVIFFAPVDHTSIGNFWWVLGFSILFYAAITAYCTPYNALISEFGKTQEDRMYISTAISLTFFVGTLLAYVPFLVSPMIRGAVGFAWSYRICFMVLSVIGLICCLIPAFLLNEKEFVNTTPARTNAFKSLAATFKNKHFRVFVGSDVMYFMGLALFQTGLPFFIKIMSNDVTGSTAIFYMGGMTVLSAAFYPFVTKLVKKFGKKKLVIAGFLGLAVAYLCITMMGRFGKFMYDPFTIAAVIIAAFPMALLGIIPQSIVADVAEAEAVTTGVNREGMFFAARTFAMKMGQSLAMLAFTSLAIIGTTQNTNSNDIVPSELGMTIIGIVSIVCCVLGAIILFFYQEKKVMKIIAKESDKEFLAAVGEKFEETKEEAPVQEEKVEEPIQEEVNEEDSKVEEKPKKASAKKTPAKKTTTKKVETKESK